MRNRAPLALLLATPPRCHCGATMTPEESRWGKYWRCLNYPDCRGTVSARDDGSPIGLCVDRDARHDRTRLHQAMNAWVDRVTAERMPPLVYTTTTEGYRNMEMVHHIDAKIRLRSEVNRECWRWLGRQLGLGSDQKVRVALLSPEEVTRALALIPEGVTAER